jgi:hypothetical protein
MDSAVLGEKLVNSAFKKDLSSSNFPANVMIQIK